MNTVGVGWPVANRQRTIKCQKKTSILPKISEEASPKLTSETLDLDDFTVEGFTSNVMGNIYANKFWEFETSHS